MKTRTWLRCSAATMLLLMAQGCNEYAITTIVSTDGSVDRSIEWKSDKGPVNKGQFDLQKFPLPMDTTWRVVWKAAEQKDSNLVFTASKHFDSFEALEHEYTRLDTTGKLVVHVTVEKRFRWFYSYFSYHEIYGAFMPYTLIPAKEFFTPEELRRLMSDEKSDSLSTRYQEWVSRNDFEFVFRRLLAAADSLHDPELPASLLAGHKEELRRVMTSDSLYKGETKDGSTDENAIADASLLAARGVVHSPSIMKLREPIKQAIAQLFQRFDDRNAIEGKYTNAVVMPGVILETNAKEISGSRVEWTFSPDQLSIMDLEMRVESRVVNSWAIVVSGVVVLGLLGLPLVLQYRRR